MKKVTSTAQLADLERICRGLADATRLQILALLRAGEVCVCDIHGALGISQPKASRHLAYLRRAGLVETRRDGQWVHYRLSSSIPPVFRPLLDAAARCAGDLGCVCAPRRS